MAYKDTFTTTELLLKDHNLNSLSLTMTKNRFRRIHAKTLKIANKKYQSKEVSPNVKLKRY